MALTLLSSAFEHQQSIPPEFTPEGHNISPPLTWLGTPAGTRAFALVCDDPDAPSGSFTHWLLYDIPAEIHELPAGLPSSRELPEPLAAKQGVNDTRTIGWTGPHPPERDGPHHYRFTLYALNSRVNLRPGATKAEVEAAIRDHVLDRCTLVGLYERGTGRAAAHAR